MVRNNDKKKDFEESFGEDLRENNDVDEELLAMAPPPPSLRFAILTFSVFVLSGVMFVWFFPELKYLVHGLTGPIALGDAANIDVSTLEGETYVSLEGLPRLNTTLEYREGIRWFPGEDETCKLFPVVGQPNLFVQWTIPAEHKAYRDEGRNPSEPTPASFFQGRLVNREKLKKKNFKRIWVYFDCLKVHSAGRCRYCLGRNSMEECRRAFTCVESLSGEECGRVFERSEENLASEIQEVQKAVAEGVSLEFNTKKLQQLKDVQKHLLEQRAAVLLVRLEEAMTRLSKIEKNLDALSPADQGQFARIGEEVIGLRLDTLKILARQPLEVVGGMSEENRRKAKISIEELKTLREDEKQHIEKMRLLNEYVDIDDELRHLRRWIGQFKEKLPLLSGDKLASLTTWNLDPRGASGKEILRAMSILSEVCFNRPAPKLADGGVDPASGDGGIGPDSEIAGKTKDTPPSKQKVGSNKDVLRVASILDALKKRVVSFQRKLAMVSPGSVTELDVWARKPDILGGVPKGLKWERIIGNFDILENILAGVDEPGGNVQTVAAKKNAAIDMLQEKRDRIRELEGMPGVNELELMVPLWDLEKKTEANNGPLEVGQLEMQFNQVKRGLLEKGFLPAQLSRVPAEMTALEKRLNGANLEGLEEQTKDLLKKIGKDDWVLFDGEKPIDQIWILLIYLVLSAMMLVNLRRLSLFWKAWRAS